MKHFYALLFLLFSFAAHAADRIVNVYAWTGEVPDFAIRHFEKETGIKVNFSTFESTEIMYAKLRSIKNSGYDVVMPSSNFVDRMWRQNLLEKLDKSKLTNWNNINPDFLKPSYDPQSEYSVPYIWGVTGIFTNDEYFPAKSIKKWNDLWDQRFYNKLLILNDPRDVFATALLTLGYSVNDSNPEHIKAAFLKLKKLLKNAKVFSTDTVVSLMVDEDVTAGMSFNGDAFKASRENKNIHFIFPQDGFTVWVDSFSIPKSAPHKEEAYAFINFMLRPDIAKESALTTSFATTNLPAQKLLPDDVRNSPTVYPSKEVMKRGQFLTDVGDETIALYEKYWEELKMSG